MSVDVPPDMSSDVPPDELWRQSPWPNVIEEENKEEQAKLKKEATLLIAIRMADGIINLQNHTAYRHFVEALEDMKKFRTVELLSARSDRQAAIETGRCLEIQGILGLVENTKKNREALANSLALVQDELTAIRNQRPQGTIP